MSFMPDLRATRIASSSLQNDVRNLKKAKDAAVPSDMAVTDSGKGLRFVGHQGRKVLNDPRPPCPPPDGNVQYTASSWKIGSRSTEIHPISGQHGYDTSYGPAAAYSNLPTPKCSLPLIHPYRPFPYPQLQFPYPQLPFPYPQLAVQLAGWTRAPP